jgi:protein-S-isoprenylcysteine O-methyltransferase Ste14
MTPVRIAIIVIWALFWTYWLGSACAAKSSVRGSGGRDLALRGVTGILIALLLRLSFTSGLRSSSLSVHSAALEAPGIILLLAGLAFAVWARIHLGANWGMPMTRRAEPELITSGAYTYVRHPIYSGLLLAGLGTAVAVNLIGVLILIVLIPYFVLSARVEERNLITAFPQAYPEYQTRSKLLIPFLL